ncbi:MAG: YvcK family protein [Candidatus Levybacteria bacterium]|nr:YvcK family protein [Candidatus Levybacteria bacterium]
MAHAVTGDIKNKKIVCLGGGIGTVNLIAGLKEYTDHITVVVSMADDGGSSGRLRRFYSIPPPGDLINCIAAMSNAESILRDLLVYRFSGDRYGSDRDLPGHKLGNLMLVALTAMTGDFNKALSEMQRIFKTSGKILPSTIENISIWAKTTTGAKVSREENIDLGRFSGQIKELHLEPANPTVPSEVKDSLRQADVIIAGPGDLYTTILPVLLVPEIITAVKHSHARKIFLINVANKLFETPNYTLSDYMQAIIKHCDSAIFDTIIMNNNTVNPIPKEFSDQYAHVPVFKKNKINELSVIKGDLVNDSFPLYHDSKKLARVIRNTI